MKTLIAKWHEADPDRIGLPNELRWNDGSRATLDDYIANLDSTCRTVFPQEPGIERHYFPGLVADVRFDPLGGHWIVTGKGIETTALFLSDPFATNDQIAEEMHSMPMRYKYSIHRATGSYLVQ